MYAKLVHTIKHLLDFETLTTERKAVLHVLVDYIQEKISLASAVNLNFICTHNSRRSHLAQVWSLVAANYYKIQNVYCYSGGTEKTAVFPRIIQTLSLQGFEITKTSEHENPIYEIRFANDASPVLAFSKKYDDSFNPKRNFAAIITCSQADEGCPLVVGADQRIAITYDDPKVSDNTAFQNEVYLGRSEQIAREMLYVFSQLKLKD